jgi:hypothetical protein
MVTSRKIFLANKRAAKTLGLVNRVLVAPTRREINLCRRNPAISVCNPPQHFRARLRVAEYNVTGVFKGKRAIFELTHRLETTSYAPTALAIGSCGTPMQGSLLHIQPLAKNQSGQLPPGRYNSRVTNFNYLAKKLRMFRALALVLSLVSLAPALFATQLDPSHQLIISVRDQKLMLVQNGGKVATYPVSTSMFGVGDSWGRMTTPIGYLAVEKKIGDNVPSGAVFHNRRLTGEILQPNAPGRDPVITRIIWLRGLEAQNAHAFQRGIYIHGTPQEKTIGRPASYGCIRMKSSDVAELYNRVPVGAVVQIIPDRLPKTVQALPVQLTHTLVAATAPPQTQTDNRRRVPKVAKAPRVRPTNSGITASALAAPPQHLTQNQPQAQPATRNQDQLGSKESTGTLTAEEMRMGGALAAQRQKAKLALNKRL